MDTVCIILAIAVVALLFLRFIEKESFKSTLEDVVKKQLVFQKELIRQKESLDRQIEKNKKKELLLNEKQSSIESTVASQVQAGMTSSAAKVASRPYFRDSSAFRALTDADAFQNNTRLQTALNENAILSYPLHIGTKIKGKTGITGIYDVTLDSCTCEDFRRHKRPCKHMIRLALEVGVLLSVSEKDKGGFLLKYTQARDEAEEKRTLQLQNKLYEYQLNFYESMFPWLLDFKEIPVQEASKIADEEVDSEAADEQRAMCHWLSYDEYKKLSDDEKYQLALDRYVKSHSKSNWQIGRDYELSVAYECRQADFTVTNYGSLMRLEDMGRDLICVKGPLTLIVQCKYWAQTKSIHEKHIFQLYGSMVSYQIEHPYTYGEVKAVFVTNTTLSDTARKVASYLKISVVEDHKMTDFPRIKCNIGHDEYGETKIYHLPMDAQYDNVQIKSPGEFYAFTVKEATDAGFRRAYRWHGSTK